MSNNTKHDAGTTTIDHTARHLAVAASELREALADEAGERVRQVVTRAAESLDRIAERLKNAIN